MDDARFGLDRRIKLAGPLKLDSGAFIAPLEVAYETYGELNAAKSNALLVCHALTGDQHVASNHPITGKPGWWTRPIGEGKPIDQAGHFFIGAKVPGSCMGSTGQQTANPTTAQPYGMDFPLPSLEETRFEYQSTMCIHCDVLRSKKKNKYEA